MQTQSISPRVRFGRFELDMAAGELYRDGKRVRLQDQPRQVLVALLERPGEIVTRETLRERLWKSDTFVDFEHGLNTAVKKARAALGDSAEAPRFIETLARRGYRFIGPIEPCGDDHRIVPPTTVITIDTAPESAAAGRATLSRRAVLAGVIALVAILAVGLAMGRAPRPRQIALAVMPLAVRADASAELSYLGIGIADAITIRLADAPRVAVKPTSAVLAFRNEQSDPARVAAALAVDRVLLGSLQPMRDNYRISLQLVGRDGVVLWGHTFDEPLTSLPQLQDRIAEQVANALRVELSGTKSAGARYSGNLAAYDLYLRGRSLLVNYTEASMREAIGYFERALAIDPDNPLTRTGIATASAWFSVRYAHNSQAVAWAKRAEDEARRALAQDESLAEAHLAIAHAAGTAYGGFNWKVVLERTATALALDPSLDLARLARMRAFYHLGRFDDMRREGRLAHALNPTPNVEHDRLEVVGLIHEGQYATAVRRAEPLLGRTDAPAVRQYWALATFYAGDATRARDMLASVTRDGGHDIRALASLASVEAATGMPTQARAHVDEVLRSAEMDHHIAYSLGAALGQLGDKEAAVAWLERAADTGFPCYPWFKRDPLLDPLRGDPKFVALLARLQNANDDLPR
jgi:DNA-binding winged helix-turn-helix (wHTH) protein/TolB-like protein